MIIEPIASLYVEDRDRIKANKLRMSKISEIISNQEVVDSLFSEIHNSLIKLDVVRLSRILSEQLFFEEVYASTILKLVDGFGSSNDKEGFIQLLKDSYILRGVKGIRFAWTPIIDRIIG